LCNRDQQGIEEAIRAHLNKSKQEIHHHAFGKPKEIKKEELHCKKEVKDESAAHEI
jgi:hypothetical protein